MSVVVVGGGVLGFMHALEARRLGHPVTHLEREPGSFELLLHPAANIRPLTARAAAAIVLLLGA
jgi:NADPH-dependent 2,4-dienoyl-CoA reductase/sulfur reductase-like enzyme